MQGQRKILMVIAQQNFRDEEYEIPKEVFQRSGYEVKTVSERKGEAIGKFGARAWIDMPFVEINVSDFGAVVFVGGPGAKQFFNEPEALNLARDFQKEGKVIAAICIAPSILANAGLLQDKKVTAFADEKENLESKGAIYTGKAVEVDDSLVTANGPEAAGAFAEKIVEILG